MAFTYIGDLSTDLDKIRFRIQDTVENSGPKPLNGNFTDEEINGLLTIEGTVGRTEAALYETLESAWANYIDTEIGSRDEKQSQVAKRYAAKAARARKDYGYSEGNNIITIGMFDEDISENEPT